MISLHPPMYLSQNNGITPAVHQLLGSPQLPGPAEASWEWLCLPSYFPKNHTIALVGFPLWAHSPLAAWIICREMWMAPWGKTVPLRNASSSRSAPSAPGCRRVRVTMLLIRVPCIRVMNMSPDGSFQPGSTHLGSRWSQWELYHLV